MVVPDAEEVKDLYPDEYQLYERLGIKSVLAIPLEPRQIALIAVRNPQRYIHQTSMLKLLAYVLLLSLIHIFQGVCKASLPFLL